MNQNIKLDTVDFNSLVKSETNVILNSNCTSKMIEILNKEFTESENRWYIANLYIYMNYHPTNDFPITLETLVSLVGFANKENAKRTLKNNFKENIDYKVLLVPKDELVQKIKNGKNLGGAGLNKERVMLNIDTFKNMCMLVKTEKSKEIRSYYVKLENIYNKIIKEELEEQKRITEEQQKVLEEIQKTFDNTIEEKSRLDKQKILLQQYKFVAVLYLVLVKTLELGKYILKIGHSEHGITRRFNDHLKAFPECILLDCFQVRLSGKFETFVHNELKHWRYKKLPGFEKQQELFIVGDGIEYNDILDIINKNIDRFNNPERIIKELEIENIKLLSINQELETENLKLHKELNNFDIKKLENEQVELQKHEVEEPKTVEDVKREIRLEDARKRTQKYRQSEKYREKIKTEEFRKKDNERKRTETYKQKREEYKQTEEYKQKRIEYNKKKRETRISKADIANSEYEKNKLFNWCKEHIIYDKNSIIEFKTFLEKYTIKTCPQVQFVYKSQIEQFIKEKFPTVNNLHKRYEIDKTRFCGWKNLKLI